VNLDDELRTFFSGRQRLTQIDQLHRLLFQCLQTVQAEMPDAIGKALDEIAEQRSGVWDRRDGVPLGRNGKPLNQTHIGLVRAKPSARWPADLWVHFGHYSNFFTEPWIGVYTVAAQEQSFRQIQDAVKPLLDENASQNVFTDNEPYPIWKGLEGWPKACTGSRISAGASVVGLERLLDEGDQGALSSITEWFGRMLDAFEAD
jgi:hypothetical protein